jgi:renalase
MTPSVAVVGAGLAGLACAAALQAAGRHVVVLEKSRGVGGRMSTRRGDGWQADHGAQYFTARDAGFRAEVAAWQAAGAVSEWRPRLHVIGARRRRSPQDETDTQRFVGVPGMTAPARALASGVVLRTRHTVDALHAEGGQWRVHTLEAGVLPERFSHVLLALPAAQALPLLQPHAAALAALAASARMQPCMAMILRFDAPASLPFDAAFVNQGPLRWIARDGSKPAREGAECWILHAEEQWSAAHLETPLPDACALLLRAFSEVGGPAPSAWTAHLWRYASGGAALAEPWAFDAGRGLGLCGDWLAGGRVEGAWLSGRALAQASMA